MGYQHLKPTLFVAALLFLANAALAQTPYLKEVFILNGGQYGNPQEDVVLIGVDPATGTTRTSDTIHTESIQDLLIDGDFAFVAAQDSLVKIDLSDLSRVAAVAFPGASTNVLATYQNQLLVANFHSQTDSNLYVFNKTTLALEHIVGGILQGVKGIAIIGDTAYLAQNLTSSSWSDSAGYLALVYLPTGTFVKNIPGDNVSDIGNLFVHNGNIVGLGSASDKLTTYSPANGTLQQDALGIDLEGSYGSKLQLVGDTLFAIFGGKIGSYNLATQSVINASIVDTLITAFAYDTLNGDFYVTQTDYFSYTRGIVFNNNGTAIDTFPVGYSPEVIKLHYGTFVGVEEIAVTEFTLYPNPTTGNLWVRLDNSETATLLLRDFTGRVLQTLDVAVGTPTSVDLSNLATGIYLLQSTDGKTTKKVVKQ